MAVAAADIATRLRARAAEAAPSPRLSGPQRSLFTAWGIAVGASFMQDVVVRRDWPCPGRYVKISGLYLILGLLSEAAPTLAQMLGWGFLVAYLGNQASREVAQRGTFFGIRVGQPTATPGLKLQPGRPGQ